MKFQKFYSSCGYPLAELISIIKSKLNYPKNSSKDCTLTIRGFIVNSTEKGTNAKEQKFDWKNALIDAAITSGVTFFSTLGAGYAAGLASIDGIKTATVAAFTQFFVFLALKRGIVQPKEV